jgi:hypothetical protein
MAITIVQQPPRLRLRQFTYGVRTGLYGIRLHGLRLHRRRIRVDGFLLPPFLRVTRTALSCAPIPCLVDTGTWTFGTWLTNTFRLPR